MRDAIYRGQDAPGDCTAKLKAMASNQCGPDKSRVQAAVSLSAERASQLHGLISNLEARLVPVSEPYVEGRIDIQLGDVIRDLEHGCDRIRKIIDSLLV